MGDVECSPDVRPVDAVKTCTKCGVEKPLEAFSRTPRQRDGRHSWCKACHALNAREWRAKNPDRAERAQRAWKAKHPEVHAATKYRAHLKAYGLTENDYDWMLSAQGGACLICKGQPADGRRLAVDHDHACCPGKKSCGYCVRGLLCGRCNSALGHFKDDPNHLKAALEYLGAA